MHHEIRVRQDLVVASGRAQDEVQPVGHGERQERRFQADFEQPTVERAGRQTDAEVGQAHQLVRPGQVGIGAEQVDAVERPFGQAFEVGAERAERDVDEEVIGRHPPVAAEDGVDHAARGLVDFVGRVIRHAAAVLQSFAGHQNDLERLRVANLQHVPAQFGDGVHHRLATARQGRVVDLQAQLLHVAAWMKAAGKGVIGMKILGAGALRNKPDECLQFALAQDCVDCFTIGSESRAEFEDLCRRIPAASTRG